VLPELIGFLFSGGNFTSIDFPGAAFSYASGINPRGEIAGDYNNGQSFGFLLSGGTYLKIDAGSQYPGTTFTNALAVNPRGDVVGRYVLSGKSHGYRWNGGQFSTIDFPNAIFTGAASINPEGDIVGRYRTGDGKTHGFLLSKGEEGRNQDER